MRDARHIVWLLSQTSDLFPGTQDFPKGFVLPPGSLARYNVIIVDGGIDVSFWNVVFMHIVGPAPGEP